MKHTPIIFTPENVIKSRNGIKTMTRRIVKHPEYFGCLTGDCPHQEQATCDRAISHFALTECPYGQVGDVLWVKERWCPRIVHHCNYTGGVCDCDDVEVIYAADDEGTYFSGKSIPSDWTIPKTAKQGNVSPLFMPRWASRLSLKITEIRVERVQDISEEDARREGCDKEQTDEDRRAEVDMHGTGYCTPPWDFTYRNGFERIWKQINSLESWKRNDWTWVLGYQRIDGRLV